MKFTQIKETCLYTTQLDRAEQFYTTILGLEMIGKEKGRYVFFRAGSSVLLIFNPEASATQTALPSHDGSGRVHFAFETDAADYEPCKQELISKGITITHEHQWKNGRSFYFEDPDGHVLEVLEGDAIW